MRNKKYYRNGQVAYEIADGVYTSYYKSAVAWGTPVVYATGPYIEGKMEGDWVFFRRNGMLWKAGAYKNGEKQGMWKQFDRKGQLKLEEEYNKGWIVKK